MKSLNKYQKISILLMIVFLIAGMLLSLDGNNNLNFGDVSLFHTFANNIANGEVIYRDFIHFRTPGSYYLYALMLNIFSGSPEAIFVSLRMENFIYAPLVSFIAIWILFRKNKMLLPITLVFITSLVFLHGVFQLRIAIPFLIASVYYLYKNNYSKKLAIIIGMLFGFNLMFGQETAILTGFLIFIFELANKYTKPKTLIKSLGLMILGFIIILAPFLIYLGMNGALSNFIYYVFYYAIFIQPTGMNIDFPKLNGSNLYFIMPFVAYTVMFIAAYLNKYSSTLRKYTTLLLPLVFVQSISLLGRTDTLHLSFIAPILVITLPITIKMIHDIDKNKITKNNLFKLSILVVLMIVFTFLAIKIKSMLMIVVALISFVGLNKKPKIIHEKFNKNINKYIYGTLVSVLIIFTSLSLLSSYGKDIYATGKNRVKTLVSIAKHGVKIKPINSNTEQEKIINEVTEQINEVNPNKIFSFPIQPYFYNLGIKHATRFMSFEPQTTKLEQQQTIEDLKRNKPGIVIMDAYQVSGMPYAVDEIVNYVTANYKIKDVVDSKLGQIWIMVPKDHPSSEYIPALTYHKIYKDNPEDKKYLNLYNYSYGINNALMVYEKQDLNLDYYKNAKILKTSVKTNDELNSDFQKCGYISAVDNSGKMLEKKKYW